MGRLTPPPNRSYSVAIRLPLPPPRGLYGNFKLNSYGYGCGFGFGYGFGYGYGFRYRSYSGQYRSVRTMFTTASVPPSVFTAMI
jgi:hypothetical protein